MIDALPAAIYTTDARGKLTHYNAACVAFSGRTPELGSDHWCVTWKLFYPDGRPMPHDECPMAVALKEGRIIRGAEAIAERPDGSRIWFTPYPTPLFDDQGNVTGGINMLVDITERKQAEARRVAEATALIKLNQLSSRLWRLHDLREGLDEMLAATIDLLGADFGNIQIMDARRGVLAIAAQRGFDQDFLNYFREVAAEDDSACGRALRGGERIIVEDVETDERYAPMRPIARSAGYRAVQSTPLIGRDNALLGMISTHFRAAHRPGEHELHLLDLYARQATDFIERCKSDEALRRNEAQLEAELADTKLLQRLSAAMIQQEDIEAVYSQIMDAAVAIMRSDFASMQMLYPERGRGGELRLLAFRGFNPQAARFWEWVRADSESTCGEALRTRRRAVAADVEQCDYMAGTEDLATYLATGIRAVQSTPLISRDGTLVGMISTHWNRPHEPSERDLRLLDILARQAADLIERIKAGEAVRASERELSDFFDNASVGLHWAGPDGIILRVNQAELDLLGYGRDQYVGRHIAEFHADQPVIEDILARLTRGETLRECPARLRCRDGSIRDVLINSSVLFEDGQFIHTRCFTTDVTERKRAEEQLRQAKREAESANRAKDRFLAVLSHELRTPLTPVLMTAAALEGRDDLSPDLREDVTMIRRNVELQSRLIDDLLDLSRITSGKLRLSFDVHSINDLVRHACDTCRSNLRERGIRLFCDLQADAFDVVGDGGRLQQVFWNLLNNATKFTPEGGQVFVRTENVVGDAGQVRVTVRDTGIGIAPAAAGRIFDAFEQAEEGITRQFGGMGLGLAICRALVEQHRGSIRAHSDGKDKGSTFVVELPALARPAEAGTEPQSRPPEPEKLRPLRLLLVEDHGDTAAVLARLLAQSGHEVKAASTAAEAMKLADEHAFDLVVSDLGLPDMTGYELMKQIKQRYPDKCGIAMSGYGMEEDIRKSQQAGFSDHLVKPVSLGQLEQSLRRVAGNGMSRSTSKAPS